MNPQNAIEVAGLSVTLGTGTAARQVLHDVSFQVAAGSWTAILGPNGAGKTTLLRAILGHQPQENQRSQPASVTISPATPNIAFVPQRPEIPAFMTVAEYVALGRSPRDGWGRETAYGRAIREQNLGALDLAALANRQLTQLSGGEQQRAVLARALTQQPDILLLDEPTAGLDIHHKAAFMQLIEGARRDGLTVVSTLHDLTLAAAFAQHSVVLQNGRVALQGPTDQVVTTPEFAAVFDNRIEVHRLPDNSHVVLSK